VHHAVTAILIASCIVVGMAINLLVLPPSQAVGMLYAVPILIAAHRTKPWVVAITTGLAVVLCIVTAVLGSKAAPAGIVSVVGLLVIGSLGIVVCARRIKRTFLRDGESLARDRAVRERQCMDSVLREIPDWIWEVDASGRYIYSNPNVQSILGYTPDEVIGKHIQEIIVAEDGPEISGMLGEAFRARKTFHNLSKHAFAKGGRDVWIETSGFPLIDDRGELVGYRGIDRDVTEWKRLEERLLRIERFGMARHIAGRVAHDLNDLLAPLVGYPDLIRAQLPADHPAIPFCDKLLESALRVADISEHLLALGRRGQPPEDPVNVNRVVEEAIKALTNRPQTLVVDLDLAVDLLPVIGSAVQLERVVGNLVTNAREAMRDHGVLTIKTENIYVDEPMGTYNRVAVGEYVRLQVRDRGPGIPPETQDQIFDPFFTTKPTHRYCESGSGLSIVQVIVDDHQGYVDVESLPGLGSTFSIYLPINREILRETHGDGLPGGSETMLIVDDDVDQREFMERTLETLGYRVQTVISGEEALAYLRKRSVDLVILDMVVPAGLDGAETYRRILEMHPGQRAIILSGTPEAEHTKRALELGAGACLRKPLTLAKLARAVRRELDQPCHVTPHQNW
jgi:two-component system cell cycle sensor histidine kinase/response regulator CckA